MSRQQNVTNIRRFVDEVFNGRKFDALDELYQPDAYDHNMLPGLPQGPAGRRAMLGIYLAAFPDMRLSAEDIVAEEDRVALRWRIQGTHQGELMGIPATGKAVDITGAVIRRYADGKVAEHWEVFDQVGMLQQLGVIPTPNAA